MPQITGPIPRSAAEERASPRSPFDSAGNGRFNSAEFANIALHEGNFWWYRGMRRIQLALLDPYLRSRPVALALEAGCGVGYFAALLQRDYKLPLIAMDYSGEGLRYGSAFHLQRATQGNLSDLPFAAAAFDLALCLDVLQQLEPGEERQALAELARVVKPGGALALRVSAFRALRSRHSEYVYERQRFTRAGLTRLVESAGFRVLRATYGNALLLPAALFKFRVLEPLQKKRAESGIQPAPRWINRALYSVLAAEATCLRAGLDLPFGQSLLMLVERLPD